MAIMKNDVISFALRWTFGKLKQN